MACVYEHRCTTTGKSYIGKTKLTAKQRFAKHVYLAESGSDHLFHRAIRKHGASAFTLVVHADNLSDSEATFLERDLINRLSTKAPRGYNLTDGGDGIAGFKHSDRTRARLTEVLRLATANRGPVSEETRKRLSASKKGHAVSEVTRRLISEANSGRVRSEATLAKMSAVQLGKKRSADSIAKQSETLKATYARQPRPPSSDETRAKMRSSHLGKTDSPETRQRKRAAALARFARIARA